MPAIGSRRNGGMLNVASRSVVKSAPRGQGGAFGDFILSVAQQADGITQWTATTPHRRDQQLRDFWKTESTLAGALYSKCAQYAAFGWRLSGPSRMTGIVRRMLHSSDRGMGWQPFLVKLLQDIFATDNGGFIELLRTDDDPTAPTVMLNHLDSMRCRRTGDLYEPVEYTDIQGMVHALKWYQVVPFSEFPMADEQAHGVQFCAVSRTLRAAQIMRDIAQYKKEKISGRNVRAIHLVGGVSARTVRDAMRTHQLQTSAEGFQMYVEPLVVASVSPNATVSKATIEMASLPDGFDEEVAMRWYVNQLALAFGSDYQDFAPLPGGNLGTAQQSQVLHLKARGKGPALFMSMLETYLNFRGVMPASVTFRYGEQDQAADEQEQKLRIMRAQERAIRLKGGGPGLEEITPAVARQLANDAGDLREEYLELMNEQNTLDEITISSTKEVHSPTGGRVQIVDGEVVTGGPSRTWQGWGAGQRTQMRTAERDGEGRIAGVTDEVVLSARQVVRRRVERDDEGRVVAVVTEEDL